MAKRAGKISWNFHGGDIFFILARRLRHNIKTFISRLINCLVLQTDAFIKILKWKNILYHCNLTKIIQHNSVLNNGCKKKIPQCVQTESESLSQRYVFLSSDRMYLSSYHHFSREIVSVNKYFMKNDTHLIFSTPKETRLLASVDSRPRIFYLFCRFQCVVIEK